MIPRPLTGEEHLTPERLERLASRAPVAVPATPSSALTPAGGSLGTGDPGESGPLRRRWRQNETGLVLGRKNYLFVHDGDTGASIAGLYSLVATCEARKINPFEYLSDVLTRVQDQPTSAIDELLPGAWAAARDQA